MKNVLGLLAALTQATLVVGLYCKKFQVWWSSKRTRCSEAKTHSQTAAPISAVYGQVIVVLPPDRGSEEAASETVRP